MELSLGLYLSSFISLGLMTILSFFPFILLLPMGLGSFKIILSAALGLFLLISAFIAVGLYLASLTKSPLPAAMATLGTLGFFWAMGWAAPYLSERAGALAQGLAFTPRLGHFTLGLIDLNDLLYFLILTSLGLWLCRPLED
jgi:ABC-2 type transport system permease protein